MAKYSGIVDIKGTIGNLSFYKRKGVRCVRRPGGFTKEQLETDPRLRRVLEHTREFGAQSMASKSLRTAFAPLKIFCDGNLHNRLMPLEPVLRRSRKGYTANGRWLFRNEADTEQTRIERGADALVVVCDGDKIGSFIGTQLLQIAT